MEVTCGNLKCGKRFVFKGGPAHFARSKKHYCSRSCQNVTHGLAGSKIDDIWNRTKRRAIKNGILFTLTIHDIPSIPERCPILDIAIIANSKAGPLDSSPSLDRIVPARGYIPTNVRIISNRANRLRSDATARELFILARDAEQLEKQNA